MFDLDKLRGMIAASLVADGLTEQGAALVPKEYSLESFERFQPAPNRFRGTFNTGILREFADYVMAEGNDDSRVFVDPEAMCAVARIDHGDTTNPQWGDHKATLACRMLPEYTALLALAARPEIKTAEFVDWILDWRPALAFSRNAAGDDWDDISAPQAIQALRKIKVATAGELAHEETDLSRVRTAMERAAIVSEPPATLRMLCVPFDGLAEREFHVRLGYYPKDPPTLRAHIVQHAAAKNAMADEFRALLASAITACPIHIGTFKH